MIAPVLVGLVVLAVFAGSAWQSWRARVRLLARIRAEWGYACDRARDMEAVADFFRSRDATGATLDDRAWDDLLMVEVESVLALVKAGESAEGGRTSCSPRRTTPSWSICCAIPVLSFTSATPSGRTA